MLTICSIKSYFSIAFMNCPNRLVTKTETSINLLTQLFMQVSVRPSNLLPGLSTHLSQQISLNS